MSRPYRVLQVLLAATSKLPWRIAVGLALLSFLALHLVADIFEELAAASSRAGAGSVDARQVVYVVAFVLQFILPIGFLSNAVASLVQRLKAIRLLEAPPDDTPEVVRGIGWREFELLICEAFRGEGYRVEERGGSGPDGGIDLIATKAKKRILIQCKHWKTQQVGVALIRDLHEIVAARRADGGVIVAGGSFTKEARDLARAYRIRLIDGVALQQMIGSAQSSSSVSRIPAVEAAAIVTRPAATGAPPAAPSCPKCGAEMVDRVAKQGKFAGRHFWGCSQFPKCMGIAIALEPDQGARRSRSPAQLSTG